MQITLTAKTLKGKNRIHEAHVSVIKNNPTWQDIWIVGKTYDIVAFSQLAGPWFFIYPKGVDTRTAERLSRWVHKTRDADFEVVVKDLATAS